MYTSLMLAQSFPRPQASTSDAALFYGAIAICAALVFFSFVILLVKRFKRCPSNRVLVIYGKAGGDNKAVKCLHGGATFVWPLIQDYAYLYLEPIQIEIPLRGALSAENIRVNVPSVFTVAVGTLPEVMNNAAIRLLGLNVKAIEKQAQEIIFGQLRQVIASMKIEDINRDRDTFLAHVQNSLEPELKKIGLVLINVNITDITDEAGYIDAIGQKAASQAIQQARGDVADQLRIGETRVAEAERDKTIQISNAAKEKEIGMKSAMREQTIRIAELEKEKEIGIKAALREQAIKIAEFEKDQKVGEQAAAFQRDMQVKEAEREMRIKTADANAKAITGENSAQESVAISKANLSVRQAEAYQLAETKKREAEAAVLEAQNRAMAKAAIADAERVEAERRAEFEAPAKAQKAKMIVDAEAFAERVRIQAEGDASAIFAKLDAEARGQYEILAKKAEGLKMIVESCGGAHEAFQMLMLDHLNHLTDASAKAISNIKFDKIVVWENGGKDGGSNTANFLQNMARTLPPMMQVMRDVAGIELPETLLKLTPDAPATPVQVAATPEADTQAVEPDTAAAI